MLKYLVIFSNLCLMTYSFLWYQGNIQGNNLKRDKDSGEGIEGNWDYHPIYPVWPSAPPPPTAE